jgi:hypothetical protein
MSNTKWQTRLQALRQYVTREGTTNIPDTHIEQTPNGPVALGSWANWIRYRGRNGKLTQPRHEEISEIPGWTWEPKRPGPKTEAGRDDQIKAMRNSGASLQEIGDHFGLSRQRIHQIVRNK